MSRAVVVLSVSSSRWRKLLLSVASTTLFVTLAPGCGSEGPSQDPLAAGGTGGGEGQSGGSSAGGALVSGAGGVVLSGSGGAVETAAGGNSPVGSGGMPEEPRPTVTAEPGSTLVKVDVNVRHQSFEGWGTSLCWWANHVGAWSEAARNALVDAVVDPVEGLGYNIFRYNIGGGENPSHEHMGEHREMPGFQDADGSWHWDRDENQRAVLLRIAEQTDDLILEAFANSPPHWMTNSGCASGSSGGGDNLKPDAYDDFAHYLTEVVQHYSDEYGITFRTLEPLNEPYADWWKADGSQEGCHFGPSSQEQIIGEVAAQLLAKGLTGTVVSASDENSMDDALRNIGGFSEATVAAIEQINVHSYAGTRRAELKQLATDLDKRLWQSESGPLGQSISDDTDAALFMAERIIDDLRDLGAEAWLDWQTVDPSRSWTSFTVNDAQQSFVPIKRFYMHAGFSRYIRPGATFVDVNDAEMVAALNQEEDAVTLVIRNGSANQERKYTVDLTSLPSVLAAASAHRTSRDEDLVELDDLPIDRWRMVVTVPAYSLTTYVIPLR